MKKLAIAALSICALFMSCKEKDVSEITLSGTGIKTAPYPTIQSALNAIGEKKGSFKIVLPRGTYEEALYYNGDADITLSGCTSTKYGDDVKIAVANTGDILLLSEYTTGQKARCVFEFEGKGNLTLENITFQNTFERGSVSGSNTQAETIGFDSEGTLAAYNCAFKSTQDTLRMTGKSWFYKCYVEGDTDFIWMEASGKVALFEECEIVSIYDEKHTDPTTYIGAPRMEKGNSAFKGLVIFNSSIACEEGEKTFLARTPWNSGYYNQVAFINDVFSGKIEDSVWKGTPLSAEGIEQNIIGWKMDNATATALGLSSEERADVLSDEDAANEFGGRDAILNRYYDLSTLKYKKDLDDYWNVKKLASLHGWLVSKDLSKALLSGEEKAKKTTYTFDGKISKDLILYGCLAENGLLLLDKGSSVKFRVKGKSVVSITGCLSGNGTIQAGEQGAALYDFNTGSEAKYAEKAYVVYEGDSEAVIKATAKTVIAKIAVESDSAVEFTPVNAIEIAAEENANAVYGRKNLQFYAKINPIRATNGDYEWSVSDSSAATISADGLLTAADVIDDTNIIVKATACDKNRVATEFLLTVLKADPNAVSITYLNSLEASNSLAGSSDNDSLAKALRASPAPGIWKYNASKINSSFARGGITFSDYTGSIAGKDTIFVDFPIFAEDSVEITSIEAAFGNHGTSNVAVLIQGISGAGKVALVTDESRKARSVKKTYKLEKPYVIQKGETANIRVVLYGLDGSGETTIAAGKAPTIATITISGRRK